MKSLDDFHLPPRQRQSYYKDDLRDRDHENSYSGSRGGHAGGGYYEDRDYDYRRPMQDDRMARLREMSDYEPPHSYYPSGPPNYMHNGGYRGGRGIRGGFRGGYEGDYYRQPRYNRDVDYDGGYQPG